MCAKHMYHQTVDPKITLLELSLCERALLTFIAIDIYLWCFVTFLII